MKIQTDQIKGFAVYPKLNCPHLTMQLAQNITTYLEQLKVLTKELQCQGCQDKSQNWVCLVCKNIFCSRYVKGHMAQHNEQSSHLIALSLVDGSYWCYDCESYIDHQSLRKAKMALTNIKINEQNIQEIPEITSSISASQTDKKIQNNKTCPLTVKKQKYQSVHDKKNAILCNMQFYFTNQKVIKRSLGQRLNNHSIIQPNDLDRLHYSKIFQTMQIQKLFNPQILKLSIKQSRGIGAVLGMGIGDALGSCTQFKNFIKQGYGIVLKGFSDLKLKYNRHGKVSVWTDDASMGLCIADSILLNDYLFNPIHIRYLFVLWLEHGLNNGGREYSIGLGGNISISMYQFMKNHLQYTQRGDRLNNGNGSLMRLAPIPVAYCDQKEKGIQYSGKQSLTTHNGQQAQQCSKLMASIIIELIHRDNTKETGKQCILRVCDAFKSTSQSVQFLAKGLQQSKQFYNQCSAKIKKYTVFNKSCEDRKWNWRQQNFTYSQCRFNQQPGYIGSYCMDALSMALHIVMFTKSFKQVVIKNADMGGDCDTVGSIAGQIAGALYGIDQEMIELYSQMEDFEQKRYEIFLKGYKLINKKMI